MTPRFARLWLLVLSSTLVFDVRAQTPPASAAPTAAKPEDELVQIKLPDADIDTVLSALEIYTGRTILRPAALPTATYNLRFTKPMPKSEAILAIETVLALNGVGVAPMGERFLKVVALQSARQEAPEMISGSALDQPASGKVATKIFQLEFMRVAEVVPLLQGILNPFYGGPVQLQNANAALITDSVSNLQRVELLLQQLDKPSSAGMKPKFYQLRNGAKASDLVQKLRTILTGTLQIQLGQATSYSADDRTNQIVLVTDPRQHAFFDDLIDRLDVKADPNTRNEVITLNHAKAIDIVNVLSKIISGQTSAIQRANSQSVRPGQGVAQALPAATPGPVPANIVSAVADAIGGTGSNEFSSLMTVVNDDRSNSVVVSGTTDDIRLIRELIQKLDIILAQVRIEVVIAEVTITDNSQTGISALGLKLDGDKLVGFNGTFGSPATLSVTNGTVTRPSASNSVTGHFDLAAEISINTTPRKSNNTILSVPAIVTSHGKQAKFFNGETRPVVTGTVAAAGAAANGLSTSSTVAQQQIGTTMTVTPFIGVDGSVQLDIVQDVQDVIGTVQVDQNTQYIIGQRQTTSYITAKTGEIIVLGGFQKKTDTKSSSRLGPIPFIGDLLGSRSKEKSHQELIFFLRPTVLTNKPAVDNAETMNRVDQLPTRDEIKQQLDPAYQPAPKSTLERIFSK